MLEILILLATQQADPILCELRRFPSHADCCTQQTRCREHLAWLDRMAPEWPERRADFARWRIETGNHLFLWSLYVEAQEEYGDEETRLWRLTRLRYWLGEDAYFAGLTPPWLPADLHEPPREFVPLVPDIDGNR